MHTWLNDCTRSDWRHGRLRRLRWPHRWTHHSGRLWYRHRRWYRHRWWHTAACSVHTTCCCCWNMLHNLRPSQRLVTIALHLQRQQVNKNTYNTSQHHQPHLLRKLCHRLTTCIQISSTRIVNTSFTYDSLFIIHQHALACTVQYCYTKLSIRPSAHLSTASTVLKQLHILQNLFHRQVVATF